MPMKAILFVEANYPLIINESHLPLDDIMSRTKKMTAELQQAYYFVPNYISKDGYDYDSWVIIDQKTLENEFTYNADWITARFVTITRK